MQKRDDENLRLAEASLRPLIAVQALLSLHPHGRQEVLYAAATSVRGIHERRLLKYE